MSMDEATTGGWYCPQCGAYLTNAFHACWTYNPNPYPLGVPIHYQPCGCATLLPVLEGIAKTLDELIAKNKLQQGNDEPS